MKAILILLTSMKKKLIKPKPESESEPQPATTPFRFQDLPGELRNRVYEHAAADLKDKLILWVNRPSKKKSLTARSKRHTAEGSAHNKVYGLALLAVNRKIRSEAMKYVHSVAQAGLFSKDEGSIDALIWAHKSFSKGAFFTHIERYVNAIGPNLQHIKHFRVTGTLSLRFLLAQTFCCANPVHAGQECCKAYALIKHLSNVTCITITTNEKPYPDISPNNRETRMLVEFTEFINKEANQMTLQKSFPKLQEVRLQHNELGTRVKLDSNGWSTWFDDEPNITLL